MKEERFIEFFLIFAYWNLADENEIGIQSKGKRRMYRRIVGRLYRRVYD